jgi:hypothetical protein
MRRPQGNTVALVVIGILTVAVLILVLEPGWFG